MCARTRARMCVPVGRSVDNSEFSSSPVLFKIGSLFQLLPMPGCLALELLGIPMPQ